MFLMVQGVLEKSVVGATSLIANDFRGKTEEGKNWEEEVEEKENKTHLEDKTMQKILSK